MTDYLAHHGIIGQKWGIRRFQNLDGTLTAAGKERYGKDVSLVNERKMQRQNDRIKNKYDHGIKEIEMSKYFLNDIRKQSTKYGIPREKAVKLGEKYIRDIAEIRLKDMGYEASTSNIEYLAAQKWFRNSTFFTNTLASLGLNGVEYTHRDDYRSGRKV